MLNSNRTLAEENLKKEPELIERRSRISNLSEQGKELCANVQEKLDEVSKYSTFLIWSLLQNRFLKFNLKSIQNQNHRT